MVVPLKMPPLPLLNDIGIMRGMKTFGQVITEARKKRGLTQKEVASRLRREDGRLVLPPYLNDLEHDRRYPPENAVIEQLAKILNISADVLYFYAKRLPKDIERDADDRQVEEAYRAFRQVLQRSRPSTKRGK
jgi:transcriptional regulator with XRE-family HTH domain